VLPLVAIAAIAAILVLNAGAASRRPALGAAVNGVVGLDASSGRFVAATPLGGLAGSVAAADGSVWVADPGSETVVAIDPDSGVVIDRIPVGSEPGSIAAGDGAIWVGSSVGATVTRIDPTTDTVTQTIALPGANLAAITYGLSRVWVADPVERELFEIDPATGSLQRTLSVDLQPSTLAAANGAVWVAGYDSATLEKLDPTSGRVIGEVRVGDGSAAVALGAGSLWVVNSLDSTVSRVNPASLSVEATIPVGSGPDALITQPRAVWVAEQYSDTVSRIDPRRDRVTASVGVGGAPASLGINGNRLWVGVAPQSAGHRGGTLMIVTPGALTSSKISTITPDPAFYSGANNPQFMGLAYDSLVTFEQTTGAAGLRLVPDLAVSIPTPTDGDRTYTFRIRPGIRYADGQTLRAGDFRRAIDRLFRDQPSQGTFLYDGLVGARACEAHPAGCNLARGIVTNDTDRTVSFHFTAPDPEFLFQLTQFAFSAPVPSGTADHETGSRTVPGTGPYTIASVTPTEVRFVRNRFFREWSHAAQPAGNPNVIVWRSVPTIQAGVTAILNGRADWLFGQPPFAQFRQLELQYPGQLHNNPQWSANYIPLNTHLPPFNDLRVRQAINYAINRATIVNLYGGPNFAIPACQAIVPGIPGYRRYCPYTLRPRADGAWSAPDMARARQLVAQSGTTGERVDLVGLTPFGFIPTATNGYVAGVLRALGYRVKLTVLPFAAITQAMWDKIGISVSGNWIPAYPDPSSYIPSFFGCGGANGSGYYCNPTIDREMRRAELLEPNDPSKASAIWAAVDGQLTDAAVWVPTVANREVEITSRRLRNYEYNPVTGFLADQAWLP
jgi:YVTN family beta-propeller protein